MSATLVRLAQGDDLTGGARTTFLDIFDGRMALITDTLNDPGASRQSTVWTAPLP